MYPIAFEYVRPRDLTHALRLFADGNGDAKLLAGGASLVPLMKLRLATPPTVIDVGQLKELGGIANVDGAFRIGAVTRHGVLQRSSDIRARYPLLHDVASQIGDPQIRNMGTIGGSLAEADPAGDWATGLLALDATVTCASVRGRRDIALRDLLVDAYTTSLEPDEMIVEVHVAAAPARSGGAHVKLERRIGDFAVANCSVQVALSPDGAYSSVRVAIGGVALLPIRVDAAEAVLNGQRRNDALIARAAEAVSASSESFTDLRATAHYRRHVAGVLFRRALDVAERRANGKEVEIHG